MRRQLTVVLTAVLFGACVAASFGTEPARVLVGHTSTSPTRGGGVLVHVPRKPTRIGVVILPSYGHLADEPVREGWSAAADRHGFVAIYVSRDGSWNAGLCCGRGSASARDDVSWLAARIAEVRARFDLTTIYLAGFSNGGMMAERLVAERPETATRLVTWGSSPTMPRPGRWAGVGILYSGQEDRRVPLAGGKRTVAGLPTEFRPATTTPAWLLDADLHQVVVPGAAHEPPRGWPELAWRALTAPVGLAPTATGDGPGASLPRAAAPVSTAAPLSPRPAGGPPADAR